MEKIRHLIVQASGKGTRMQHLTENKPKALVSVLGLPLLYHLHQAFPDATMYLVGDYKYEVLEKYLKVYPPRFKYFLIHAKGVGSCEGLESARNAVAHNGGNSFAITWCDLHFSKEIQVPSSDSNYIGLTREFQCRWSLADGVPVDEKSDKAGIMGFFFFGKPGILPEIPNSGEFVRFLQEKGMKLEPLFLDGTKEIGTKESFLKLRESQVHSRFFNAVEMNGTDVVKRVRDQAYKHLLDDEISWYKFVSAKNYANIPRLYSFDPLRMERIDGWHPYQYTQHPRQATREEIVESIARALGNLHELGDAPYDYQEAKEVYAAKTKQRIAKIAPLVPYIETDCYIVNGKRVPNLLNSSNAHMIDGLFSQLRLPNRFAPIHGDPTFSNTLIENKTGRVVFIDPRGYFSKTKIFGDPMYDFAKLYYSVVGNYDQFNQRNFELHIKDGEIALSMESNGFENAENVFSRLLGAPALKNIKILHAFIWLSLAGYVMDDVDSMLGAYFHGLELFNEVRNYG